MTFLPGDLVAPNNENLSLAYQTFYYLMGEIGEDDTGNSVWWCGSEIGWSLDETLRFRVTSPEQATALLKKQRNVCKHVCDQRIIKEFQELVQEIRYYVRHIDKEVAQNSLL